MKIIMKLKLYAFYFLALSLVFYSYWDIRFLPVIVGSILLNWWAAAIFIGTEPGQHGPLGANRIEIVGALGIMPTIEEVNAAVDRIAP